MKPILAFETSSPVLSIALSSGNGPVIEKTVHGFMSHAEKLLPVTDQLLQSKKISIRDIATFLIGRGPGSFTGLRIGFATLKGLLALAPRECYGALSLDLIAENISLPEGSALCVALDAHREQIYSRLYQSIKGSWRPLHPPTVQPLQDWLQTLPEKVSLAGDASVRYRSQIESAKNKIHFLPEKLGYPKASTLIKLFQTDPQKLQKLEQPEDFLPLYFRLSEAEEKRHAHNC